LRLPRAGDAELLFPSIFGSNVTKSIQWDGPESLEKYVARWKKIVAEAESGRRHFFVIVDPDSKAPVGSCDLRPDDAHFRAGLGLWIAEHCQGRGLGSRVVAALVEYAFHRLGLCKLEASVFVGNQGSRRVCEKNGFVLEGTLRCAAMKQGRPVDEWLFGRVNHAHSALRKTIPDASEAVP
jgi:RimJ/RimL family protein N-acetyltransferase